MTKKVEINIILMVPTTLRMEVSWDEDRERAVVHRVEYGPIRTGLNAKDFNENLGMENIDALDLAVAEALGIDRG